MSAFRILIADDHPIFRFGLSALLRSRDRWEVCGEAADGRDAVEKCARLKPDLLILDICLPKLNGVDCARQIVKNNPSQKILVLTNVGSEQLVRDCLEAGVRGWVYKSDGMEELISTVEALQCGRCMYSPRVSDLIMNGYLQPRGGGQAAAKVPGLSLREREIVQLVAEGKSTKEVAMLLKVTGKTIDTHRSNIMHKLNIHSIAELVLYAVENEIVHVQLPALLTMPDSRLSPVPPSASNGNLSRGDAVSSYVLENAPKRTSGKRASNLAEAS